MSDTIIRVENLGKKYVIGHQKQRGNLTFREMLTERTSSFTKKLIPGGNRQRKEATREEFWALKDVSFEVKQGDVVGIIGRNGAGKSTLLKILSRITEPTEGRIAIKGRVASLLEVGTGFHPELTGRENIFLNGAVLGMSRAEIKRKFDEIVDFAEVEKFLDTPVKRYSSGMYVRLAFAVAAHLEPEILVVDEVLAVGDAAFQKKCLGKMSDVASKEGRTVLFVSHNMGAIQNLCKRSILIKTGLIDYIGDVQSAVQKYLNSYQENGIDASHNQDKRAGAGQYRFEYVSTTKGLYQCSEEKVIEFRIGQRKNVPMMLYLTGFVINEQGLVLLQLDSRLVGKWFRSAEIIEGYLKLKQPWLKPGKYRVDLHVCTQDTVHEIDVLEGACYFNVDIEPYPGSASVESTRTGVVFADYSWESLLAQELVL